MSERLSFALVLFVALASVASILFMSGASNTGFLTTQTMNCEHVRCPGHAEPYLLMDENGRLIYNTETGRYVCMCPQE